MNKTIEQKYPEPTCGALIFNSKGQLFLMKSHKWKDKYTIPGGHIEVGEKMSDALKREVKEETGMDIRDIEFICFQEFILDEEFWKKRHFIFFDFACKTDSTDVKLNSEGQEFIWTDAHDSMKLSMDPYTKKAIEEYLRSHKC